MSGALLPGLARNARAALARNARVALACILAAPTCILPPAVLPRPALAQDFAPPASAGPGQAPCVFLERGLPPAAGGPALEGMTTRWHGLPDLTTRAAALGIPVGEARVALGLSQTGAAEVGWTAASLALGAATAAGGAGLRAVARRDCEPRPPAGPLGAGSGAEAGGGAWVEAAPGLVLWASAPQVWTRGAAPPLKRGLELGAAFRTGDLALWLARGSPARGLGAAGEHTAGVEVGAGPLTLWLEARDQPLRGGLGLAARAGPLTVATVVESHPVLGETVRLGLVLAAGRGAP